MCPMNTYIEESHRNILGIITIDCYNVNYVTLVIPFSTYFCAEKNPRISKQTAF